MSSNSARPFLAAFPFYGDPADLILRTCDNVDYQVVKAVLILASPIFGDMLSLPQPRQPLPGGMDVNQDVDENDIPVVTVSESSLTLDRLLRVCYPTIPPDLEALSIQDIGDILEAAQKYDIECVTIAAGEVLKLKAEKSEMNAFSVYAMACRFRLKEEARAAAISCLKWPLPGPQIPDLVLISGADFYNLVQFHVSSNKAVSALMQSGSLPQASRLRDHSCSCGVHHKHESPDWWTRFLNVSREAMRTAPFDTSKLTIKQLLASLRTGKCQQCHSCQDIMADWDRLKESIITSMKASVDKIDLSYSWS